MRGAARAIRWAFTVFRLTCATRTSFCGVCFGADTGETTAAGFSLGEATRVRDVTLGEAGATDAAAAAAMAAAAEADASG